MISRYSFGLLVILCMGCKVSEPSFEHKINEIKQIVSIVKEHHVLPKTIDDNLSAEMFRKYFSDVDKNKLIFTEDDIDKLRGFETTLDNELIQGNTIFLEKANHLFQKRKDRVKKTAYQWIEFDFDILVDDFFVNDFTEFSKNNEDLKERWRVKIKQRYIEELHISILESPSLNVSLQKERAKSKTKLYFDKYFSNLDNRSQQEIFDLYINSYVGLNDFQSKFLSVEAKKRWDNSFNRSYVGVGMVINVEGGGYPVIDGVPFDGPSWKTRRINIGDVIISVKNEEKFVDVAGFTLASVINLLKGEEGSLVTIKIKNKQEKIEEVVIQREQIKFDRVKVFVLQLNDSEKKIGYIKLPRFYAGETGSASDVLDAIFELKENKIDGLLFDVRDNKGGSSGQANRIIGYFLKGDVCLYLLSKDGEAREFKDEDSKAQFSGELIVMVNSKSGSASELFSGTIKDYGRGIVVGSQTFGKGSFQRFYDVTATDDSTNIGSIKLTHGSFYSGGGHSNQLKGVTPDIVLPTEKMYIPTGERAVDNALTFPDLLLKNDIKKVAIKNIHQLKESSQDRIALNPFFNSVQEKAIRLSKKESINLNYEEYKKNKQSTNSELLIGFPFQARILNQEKYDPRGINHWESNVKKDPYVYENLLIMKDLLNS